MLKKYDRFKLSEKDVTSQLGRKPSEIEYNLLKHFFYSRYLNHPIPELRNILAKNNQQILYADSQNLVVGTESKNSITTCSALRTQYAFGIKPILKFHSSLSKITLGKIDKDKKLNYPIHGNESLLFIQDGANLKKACSEIIDLGYVSILIVHPGSLGNVVLDLSKNSFGLDLKLSKADDTRILSDIQIHGVLCVLNPELASDINNICHKQRLSNRILGQLKSSQFISLLIHNILKASLPLASFFPSEAPSQTLTPVVKTKENRTDIKTVKELKNYSKHVLTIWKLIKKQKLNYLKPKKYAIGTMAVYKSKKDIAVAVPDNSHFLKYDIKTGSRILIANASRQLVNKGFKPLGFTMIMHGGDLRKNDDQWEMQEMVMGAVETSQLLNMKLINLLMTSDNIHPDLDVCVFGEKMVNTIHIDESYQNENDFISMLGSHRGELNGSLYQKEIQKISSKLIPSVDLGMEARLQEVVLQGIQTRLIQSVSNVSTGGLAAAIAKSISQSENGIGARIHLSRKLRQDEMLFGETQGLVIVSIEESDLMEFERICMNIGIPSTTIGRVTGDGRFQFNDVVNVARDDF
ncbi:MAG: hypothetical protein IIB95_08930 [Candidatus Marinimicrobia bacterium]|nr:hypothetical protein [Candidatus Neomarinimicrobiota bacterium]